MKKNILLLCCIAFACTAFSQKKQKKAVAKASASVAKSEPKDVASEINDYKFEAAAIQLQKEIATAKKQKLSTELLESQLMKCRLGSNMLQATEKVVFVDSIIIERDNFLSSFILGKESGRIDYFSDFFKSDKMSDKLKQSTVYLSDFEDKVYFPYPDENGITKINMRYKTNDKWGKSIQIEGLGEDNDIQDFPFVMADGVTLYYAAQSEESLGGYDIFVTRYNSDTKQFLKPENIGMPFNSPANDYLFAIDELNNLGWFVTDRNQPSDKVCIYIFIPTVQRETYDNSAYDDGKVADFARINSISDTQADRTAVEAAKMSLTNLIVRNGEENIKNKREFVFFLNDNTVYTYFGQFKNPKALELARKVMTYKDKLEKNNKSLDKLRSEYSSLTKKEKEKAASEIMDLETETFKLNVVIREIEKNIRVEELGQQ